MGRFVDIAIAEAAIGDRSGQVVRICPVDIFIIERGRLTTVPDREDECLLCGQCVAIAPDAVTVSRAYGRRLTVAAADRGSDG